MASESDTSWKFVDNKCRCYDGTVLEPNKEYIYKGTTSGQIRLGLRGHHHHPDPLVALIGSAHLESHGPLKLFEITVPVTDNNTTIQGETSHCSRIIRTGRLLDESEWRALPGLSRTIKLNGTTYRYLRGKRHSPLMQQGDETSTTMAAAAASDTWLPAVEHKDGTRLWYVDGVLQHPQPDAFPTIVHADGSQEFMVRGMTHRCDGPALINAKGQPKFAHEEHLCKYPATNLSDIDKCLGRRQKFAESPDLGRARGIVRSFFLPTVDNDKGQQEQKKEVEQLSRELAVISQELEHATIRLCVAQKEVEQYRLKQDNLKTRIAAIRSS